MKCLSFCAQRKLLEVYDVNLNNIENNNTNINYINPILSIYTEDAMDGMDEYQAYSEMVRDNIDADSLMQRYPYEKKDVQEDLYGIRKKILFTDFL